MITSTLCQDLDSDVHEPYEAVARNKKYWSTMKNILEERGVKGKIDVMDIFDDHSLEKQVLTSTK